jgi:hypothetical protein
MRVREAVWTLCRYRVEFEFASNPYFQDKVLWKEVLLDSADLPISAAVLREAPPIRWRKDMILTVRQVIKKAKVRAGSSSPWILGINVVQANGGNFAVGAIHFGVLN